MRILDKYNIEYNTLNYGKNDGKIDGISVAKKIGKDLESVYKTLVTHGSGNELYVFVVPVSAELDLKKAAKAAGEKKIQMIHVKDILKYTGYVRGGCSPIEMKKQYMTYIDDAAEMEKTIVVSAGQIGLQIELNPNDLIKVVEGDFYNLTSKYEGE
ncbi:MAG: Cys-tRNA(Pro) deacylase [Bacillota bacterium]|nr:Cys-tRNA(Pro) deacylase [Bacillota bacterium]